MLKVNGSSIAVPVRPPMPGMMPSTRPMMQPSPRNISRWGSISVTKALPAEAAMKPSSPTILSMSSALSAMFRHAHASSNQMLSRTRVSPLHSTLQGQFRTSE